MNSIAGIPICVLTDSYKICHPFLYPDARKMVAYGEFRSPYENDLSDQRIVFYGIRYIVENYLSKKWTVKDVEMSEAFFRTHNSGYTPFEFPKELLLKIVHENNGYFPIRIDSLPEGSVIYPHIPVFTITAENEYSRLVTFMETLLTMVWYPSTVCTLSRRSKDLIESAFRDSVDESEYFLLESRLHDFGFRGCTSVEQSVIGGCSHLLNFTGSDTMSAAFYAQFHLNNGKPVGSSIPATEHSIMTAFKSEKEAIEKLIDRYGTGVFACVMDSYDYAKALENVLPSIAKQKIEKGGYLVLRPDSGDPVEVVLMALRAADQIFGSHLNSKGYKVIKGCGVIQGDGISYQQIQKILDAVLKEGFSAQNVAFGMGAGLLQKVNRDTMSFATKLCHITYGDGESRDVMKKPKTDRKKFSLPGELSVRLDDDNKTPMVYPKEKDSISSELLRTVYQNGPIHSFKWDTFEEIQERIRTQWSSRHKFFDPISKELKDKIKNI